MDNFNKLRSDESLLSLLELSRDNANNNANLLSLYDKLELKILILTNCNKTILETCQHLLDGISLLEKELTELKSKVLS